MRFATQSAAASTSCARSGSALTDGIAISSARAFFSSSCDGATGAQSSRGVSGDVADALSVGERAELLQALVLDLPDALARDVECAADRVERPRLLAVEAVAKLEHPPLALGERAEDRPERLALERRLSELVRKRCGLVGEEVAELGLVVVADRLLERDRCLRAPTDVLDLVERHLELVRDLVGRRLASTLGAQLPLRAKDAIQLLDHVYGHANRPALVCDGPGDSLADPPRRVCRELEALAVVELLRRADEANRPFLDQVEEGQALVPVALRDRDDEAEVRLHHRLFRAVVAALDAFRELDLLGRREQPNAADVLQEELQGVRRDLGRGLDFGGHVLLGRDDLDLRLVERRVELVQLRRLEPELVERERDL